VSETPPPPMFLCSLDGSRDHLPIRIATLFFLVGKILPATCMQLGKEKREKQREREDAVAVLCKLLLQ
jgi:hypothetical protein